MAFHGNARERHMCRIGQVMRRIRNMPWHCFLIVLRAMLWQAMLHTCFISESVTVFTGSSGTVAVLITLISDLRKKGRDQFRTTIDTILTFTCFHVIVPIAYHLLPHRRVVKFAERFTINWLYWRDFKPRKEGGIRPLSWTYIHVKSHVYWSYDSKGQKRRIVTVIKRTTLIVMFILL